MTLFQKMKIFFIILALTLSYDNAANALPTGFVYLKKIDPTIIQEMKYSSSDNFIGRKVKGYNMPTCILTYPTAIALAKLQTRLRQIGVVISMIKNKRKIITLWLIRQIFLN